MNEYLLQEDLQEAVEIHVMMHWERDWKRTWKWKLFRKEPSQRWIERYIDKTTKRYLSGKQS